MSHEQPLTSSVKLFLGEPSSTDPWSCGILDCVKIELQGERIRVLPVCLVFQLSISLYFILVF